MKYRIRITQVVTIVLILMARPRSWELFFLGFVIILLGESLRIWANGYLKKDKILTIEGPYRIVRNPLYLGSFLMALGFAVICTNFDYPYITFALFVVIFFGFKFVYSLQVKAEESHLENIFGQDYLKYKIKVNRYFPDLKSLPQALKERGFSIAHARRNGEFTTVLGVFLVATVLAIKLYFNI